MADYEVLRDIVIARASGKTYKELSMMFPMSKSSIGEFLTRQTYLDFWKELEDDERPLAAGAIENPLSDRYRFSKDVKTIVFTSAQNNTHVHEGFFDSLMNYCNHNDAQLVVGTFNYNKNAFQNTFKGSEDVWFDKRIRDYILDKPAQIVSQGDNDLSGGLVWCGELNVLPTAVRPLSGLYNYTGVESGVVPHAKVNLESLATNKYSPPKMMYTTGAITQRNYVQMKAGQKASWHHVFAALVVEIDSDGDWFARQIIADSDTGCFYDLNMYYTPDGVEYCDQIEAINYGDIHVAKLDEIVAHASWRDMDSILDVLKPKYQFLHDVYDQRARNHHEMSNPHTMFANYVNGVESVSDELKLTASEIEQMQRGFSKIVVVDSNHDKALERWLREADYRKDPVNAMTFLFLQMAKYEAIYNGDDNFHLFEYAIKTSTDQLDNVRFLREDESFVICGNIECGQHGHNGANGARGSVENFIKQGMKMNTGHGHACFIRDGVYVAGVSGKLDMGYNKGASSWSHSHILTYPNGKRTIITLRDGKWRGQ